MKQTANLHLLLPDYGTDADLSAAENLTAIDAAIAALQGGGGGGGGAGGAVQIATVTVSSAELLALATTPIQLIAAPGAGKVIAPFMFAMQYKAGSTPYTLAGGDPELSIYPAAAGPNLGPVGFNATGLVTAAVDTVAYQADAASTNIARTNLDDQPWNLGLGDRGRPLTLGDGTLVVTVYYAILALA
jgi:hypothetical protein